MRWLTNPSTIAKVVLESRAYPKRIILCRNGVVKRRSIVKNTILRIWPLLRNNIIVVANLRDTP